MKKVTVIGARGLVSQHLQLHLSMYLGIEVVVFGTNDFLGAADVVASLEGTDLVIICAEGMKSRDIVAMLPLDVAVLDMSPEFRCDPEWTYGMLGLYREQRFIPSNKNRVANPGCMATAAIMLLEPLLDAGSLHPEDPIYLDAVIGYSAGGRKYVDDFNAGLTPKECAHSLAVVHKQADEIKHVCDLAGDVILVPKLGSFLCGTRVQIMVPHADAADLLQIYEEYHEKDSLIVVDRNPPNKIAADEWANKSGGCIRVYQHGRSCLVVAVIDNMRKGAVETAIKNMLWMLGLES